MIWRGLELDKVSRANGCQWDVFDKHELQKVNLSHAEIEIEN